MHLVAVHERTVTRVEILDRYGVIGPLDPRVTTGNKMVVEDDGCSRATADLKRALDRYLRSGPRALHDLEDEPGRHRMD